jgi:hypothetical protein
VAFVETAPKVCQTGDSAVCDLHILFATARVPCRVGVLTADAGRVDNCIDYICKGMCVLDWVTAVTRVTPEAT